MKTQSYYRNMKLALSFGRLTPGPSVLFGATVLLLCLDSSAPAGPTKASRQPAIIVPTAATTVHQLTAGRPVSQQLPARNVIVTHPVDSWVDHLGGAVYSTGAENIILRIRSMSDPCLPGDRRLLASPWTAGIFLVSPGPERYIGSNAQAGMEINLGILPPGEIVFEIRTTDGYKFQTGEAYRNPDRLLHAIVRSYQSGLIEVWFEDAPGPLHWDRSDRNFTDCSIQLRGGVSDNGAVADLLKVIKEQTGEPRQAAIQALKKINPKAAAMAGVH